MVKRRKSITGILIAVVIMIIAITIPAIYTFRYYTSDEYAKIYAEKHKPVITLEDDSLISIKLGDKVSDTKYTAEDDNGKDITSDVKVDDSALRRAGNGEIIFTVTDSEGRGAKAVRPVLVEPNTEYDTPGIPICMYHYVYDENDPPADLYQRFGNYISAQALEEEINWLKSEEYYFPTWQEIRDYVDGKQLLPEKSIVLTFDDGSNSFLDYGIPVIEKCKVPVTSFVITKNNGAKKVKNHKSDYVTYQSHSHNMHRPGGNIGHGGVFTALSEEDAIADLEKSIEIVGNNDAFAYPYGDYNDACVEDVKAAGFKCAVTTQAGKIMPGDNPYLLNRQRMSLGQTLTEFQNMVKP